MISFWGHFSTSFTETWFWGHSSYIEGRTRASVPIISTKMENFGTFCWFWVHFWLKRAISPVFVGTFLEETAPGRGLKFVLHTPGDITNKITYRFWDNTFIYFFMAVFIICLFCPSRDKISVRPATKCMFLILTLCKI